MKASFFNILYISSSCAFVSFLRVLNKFTALRRAISIRSANVYFSFGNLCFPKDFILKKNLKFFVFRLFSLISYLFFLRKSTRFRYSLTVSSPYISRFSFKKPARYFISSRDTVAEHLYPKEMSFGSVTSCKSDICLEIFSIFVARNIICSKAVKIIFLYSSFNFA